MCERYVLPDQAAAEREFLPQRAWWQFAPRYNVAAQQYVPAIRKHDGQSEAIMQRWGLIPASPEEDRPAMVPPIVVAADDLLNSPLHRTPWLNSQRCILPIAGFYAWQLTPGKYRQPHFVHLFDRAVFGVAAVWDRFVGDDDDVIESCSIISVAANELMTDIDNTTRRMPAILRRNDYPIWLNGTPVEARAVLLPYNARRMHAHPISPRINSTSADDPDLLLPVH